MPGSASSSFPFRLEFPPELPISARAGEIVEAVSAHPVVILAGETGSGKTTQIPKLCLAAGRGTRGRIACTQPRRVAALSVSRRVAEEVGAEWGRGVGCKVRFADHTSSDTVIKFLTDGMLLAELQGDLLLREYDTIIIDEAHERSLNIDFLLGHLRQLRFRRPDLRIVITSATIDTAAFSQAFDEAPVIEVSGRSYPVEVVYAPLDALGSDAAEGDEPEARGEALHYVEGAVGAVERILAHDATGDLLVFMPAERDIRETADLVEPLARRAGAEVIPLFGRLSNTEQQRIFAPSPRRKIILATNIAETSLTIPGIRHVVDTGLARISRYVPQGRTRRLPIEPVSRSSADQRKGRAGRVAAGVCVRLYSEADFLARPRYTQPEIQRANLADVILRLKASGLGDIERFPFINMPATKAVRAGYALLEERGALERAELQKPDDRRQMTDITCRRPGATSLPPDPGAAIVLTLLGRELARLPVDPTVGRMILQAREEKAVREVLIIAAGLSIQDPRERPLDRQAAADAAHRRFVHPDSDFLTLLNIWESLHDEFERLSSSRLRRWCHDHFLSYTRMREWRDVHQQLRESLDLGAGLRRTSVWDGLEDDGRDPARLAFGSPAYRAIHRSIVSGLLGNVATREAEGSGYRATHDRKIAIFPGSALFRRDELRPAARGKPRATPRAGRAPRWIMASEIVETSRLYARTCARLDPGWAVELGRHLLKVSHSEPYWDADKGRVMVRQRTRLYGLEIDVRAVGYGRIDAAGATEIFIREALVNDAIAKPLDFLVHNRTVRRRMEDQLTRTRDRGYLDLDEAVYRFYAERLLPGSAAGTSELKGGVHGESAGVSSVAELADLVRRRQSEDRRFLYFEADDLRVPMDGMSDPSAFPEAVPLENAVLPLSYAYRPGEPDDGVTLEVGIGEVAALTPAALDWAVPGHLAEKVEHYLRALPKEVRPALQPLASNARSLAQEIADRDRPGSGRSLPEALAMRLAERHGLRIDPGVWRRRPLPEHLRVRIRVVDTEGRELAASRDLNEIHRALESRIRELSRGAPREDPVQWRQARAQWEKPAQSEFPAEELPEEIIVGEQAGVPVKAFPALERRSGGVAVRLCRAPEEAARLMPAGISALFEQALRYELAWLEKDLRGLRKLGPLAATLVPAADLQIQAFAHLKAWATDPSRLPVRQRRRTAAEFTAATEGARNELRGVVPRLLDLLQEILTLRQELLVHPRPCPGLRDDLERLVPPDFLARTPFERLPHFPRYLRAMRERVERWSQNPSKDAERVRRLAPYVTAAQEVESSAGGDRFRWLVEEFRVSVFAQALGTSEPVSEVKLDRMLATLRGGVPAAPPGERPAPAPVLAGQSDVRKRTLKSLKALDIFRAGPR